MNNVYSNAMPSRLIIAAGLAVVAIGAGAYYLHTASKAVPTAQVAPAPAPPPPPVAANPPPPAVPAPAPDVPAAAPAPAAPPAVAQQDSSNANPTDSVTPSESKHGNRHTAKAHSSARTSDDSVVAATPPPAPAAPAAPAVDSTANATAANSATAPPPNPAADNAAPAATASNAPDGAAPADTSGVDSKITTEVKSRLAADNVSKDANIGVTTNQGVVVLTGTLASQDAVDHVKQLAQNVQDVKSVDASALKVVSVASN
jgi:hyperosmotically inducible periplasmic protein